MQEVSWSVPEKDIQTAIVALCRVDLFNAGRSSSRILQNWEEDLDATSIAPRFFQNLQKGNETICGSHRSRMTWGEDRRPWMDM